MLLLGSGVMAQSFDAQYRQAAQTASRKIEGVLPEQLRTEVAYLQDAIRFVASNSMENPEWEKLRLLRRAIIERTVVRFVYHARHSEEKHNEPQTREVDPYRLIYVNRVWNLSAYCHLRQDVRTFRLDRMESLELLPRNFNRPAQICFERPRHDEQGSIVARVLFDHEIARWVREARSFYMVSEEETPGGLLVTLRARQEDEILQWLLSWGRHVRVLEPDSLRKLLAEEARAMLENFQRNA